VGVSKQYYSIRGGATISSTPLHSPAAQLPTTLIHVPETSHSALIVPLVEQTALDEQLSPLFFVPHAATHAALLKVAPLPS
jgi:hypothetical protein